MDKTILKVKLAYRKKAIDNRMLELVEKYTPNGAKNIVKAAVCESGMRFRPLLTLTVCDVLGGNWKDALDIACAIELLHKASLVHDDIVDDDELRRGKPTLWKLYGKNQSVIAADLLIGMCFRVASSTQFYSTEKSANILNCLSDCLIETSYGEIEDIRISNSKESFTQDLESVLYNKSGSLISHSMQIGSILAGLSKNKVKLVSNIGYELGYLFQMLNDLEDCGVDAIKSKGRAGLDMERKQINFVTLCVNNAGFTFEEYLKLGSNQKSKILKPIIHLIDTSKRKAKKDSQLINCSKFSHLINLIFEHFSKNIEKYK